MTRKTRKRPPPRPQFFHLGAKPAAYDCPLCFREGEVAVQLVRSDRASIKCASCEVHCIVDMAGACNNELDAYYEWVDQLEGEERERARRRMEAVADRGLDVSQLTEVSFRSSVSVNRMT